MICYQPEASVVRPSAEQRAQLMERESKARCLFKTMLLQARLERADLFWRAFAVTQLEIAELEAA